MTDEAPPTYTIRLRLEDSPGLLELTVTGWNITDTWLEYVELTRDGLRAVFIPWRRIHHAAVPVLPPPPEPDPGQELIETVLKNRFPGHGG